MKIRITIVVLVLLWSGLAVAAPTIKVEDPLWNAGIIVNGKTYEKTVLIENTGNKPLLLKKVEECCGFFATLPEKKSLLPGEKVELGLKLAPFKMKGDLRAEIFLHTNDPARPRFSIMAVAEVVPPVHALGELVSREVSLGRIGMRDRVPFKVRLRNVGNAPLEILQVDKSGNMIESGSRPTIAPGEEGELGFEYVPRSSGAIVEKLNVVTNDVLERSLEVTLQAQVVREYVAEQALSLYPVGGTVVYDVMAKAYRFNFTVNNRGASPIEIPMVESSIQGCKIEIPHAVAAGEAVKGTVTFPGGASAAPASGWIYLQLAIPVELH